MIKASYPFDHRLLKQILSCILSELGLAWLEAELTTEEGRFDRLKILKIRLWPQRPTASISTDVLF